MNRLQTVVFALLMLFTAGCSFESDLVADAQCETGETRADGAVCDNGFWVGADLDASTPDDTGDDEDMPVDIDMGDDTDMTTCVPETNDAFCDRYEKNCGVYEDVDNCGDNRQVTCGMCDPGDVCTDNVCSCEPEDNQQFCDRLGKDCDDVTADDNCGVERTANCGTCDGAEQCGEQEANVCGCPCNIGGTCFPDGAVNANDPCLICDPAENTTDWTLDVGRMCDDGDLCTENDVCLGNGSCSGARKDCSSEDGECRTGMCDPSTGMCFGMAETGTTCSSDGISCTDDVCNAGTCEHNLQATACLIDVNGTPTCFGDGNPNPMNGCQACDPSNANVWTNNDAGSCSDGLSCTTDTCNAGQCDSVLSGGNCLIGGTCYADGAANPNDACEICDSASPNDWTLDSANCCSINGTNYADGTLNPMNDCELCNVGSDISAWSEVAFGTQCCPNAQMGSWACDGGGVCERSNGMETQICPP